MDQRGFLARLLELLDTAGVSYMIGGSVCSGIHGQSRSTNDVDIVIDGPPATIEAFAASLGSDFYLSMEAVREAVRQESMFNVIDTHNGWKADFMIRKDRAFSRTEFARRQLVRMDGLEVQAASAEDIILSKLEWSKDSESQTQYDDALGVVVTQFDRLDREYLRTWAGELGVQDQLERLFDEAQKIRSATAEQ